MNVDRSLRVVSSGTRKIHPGRYLCTQTSPHLDDNDQYNSERILNLLDSLPGLSFIEL